MLENAFHTNLSEDLSGIVGVLIDYMLWNTGRLYPLPHAKYSVMMNSTYPCASPKILRNCF